MSRTTLCWAVLLLGLTFTAGCQRSDATADEKKTTKLPPCCAGKAAAETQPVSVVDQKEAASCCDAKDPSGACCDEGNAKPETAVAAETRKTDEAKPVEPKTEKPGAEPPVAEKKETGKTAEAKPKALFDGKTLKGWKKTEFGGEGEVEVKDGMIVLALGNDMTGVTYADKPPTENYELTLSGQRLDGNDFFCSTTFPVGKEHCTLVVGGWGGTLVGISSVDGYDAADNTTTQMMTFKNNQWYRIRIRVSEPKIEAWIDGEQLVNLDRKDHKFSTRFECDPCKPLGIATWRTKGAVKDINLRELSAEEIKDIKDGL